MTHDEHLYRKIWREGYAACTSGKSNVDNPYTDCGDQEAWNDGWMECCDDAAERAECFADCDF